MWHVAFAEMLPSSASVQFSYRGTMRTASSKHSQVWNTSSELCYTYVGKKNHLCLACCPDNLSDQGFASSMSILHRYVVSVWKDKAMLQRESRLMEQQAQSHYQHFLQFKVKTAAINYTLFLLQRNLDSFSFLSRCFLPGEEQQRLQCPLVASRGRHCPGFRCSKIKVFRSNFGIS